MCTVVLKLKQFRLPDTTVVLSTSNIFVDGFKILYCSYCMYAWKKSSVHNHIIIIENEPFREKPV